MGATSTTSAPMMLIPSSPSRIDSSSLVVQPPTSEVPVAGAKAGYALSVCSDIGRVSTEGQGSYIKDIDVN